MTNIPLSPKGGPVPVLMVVRHLDTGGIERDVTNIVGHMDRSRLEPHVATYSRGGMRARELEAAGVPILHLPVVSLLSPGAIMAALRLRSYIIEHGIRVVHAWDSTAALAVPVARLCRVPAVLSSQLGYRDLFDPKTQWLLRRTDRFVDAVVVNCEAMRRHLVEDEGLPPAKVELCRNGVNTSVFAPSFSDGGVAEPVRCSGLVVGTVAVLRPEKGLPLLQEACARLSRTNPGLRLVVVGSGPELGSLQENARRLGISDISLFVPAASNVVEWLRKFDIFVLPSMSEAFSNALLEAMACGCCVVGSRVGGTPELIGNDERGLLFPPGDDTRLTEVLARLIGDERLRSRLASEALAFVRQNLTIQSAVCRIQEIYSSCLRRASL